MVSSLCVHHQGKGSQFTPFSAFTNKELEEERTNIKEKDKETKKDDEKKVKEEEKEQEEEDDQDSTSTSSNDENSEAAPEALQEMVRISYTMNPMQRPNVVI